MAAMGDASFLDLYWSDMPPSDVQLEEGSIIGPFTVLHLPGHTPGSIAFWDKEAGLLFTGDTLFKSGYGRTDLPGGNQMKIYESLNRLFAMDGNITVYPGHGEITTIGQER
jgi:glyoxylase-like metal-dependent hydrolase (beta-lactamase superfamily II)